MNQPCDCYIGISIATCNSVFVLVDYFCMIVFVCTPVFVWQTCVMIEIIVILMLVRN